MEVFKEWGFCKSFSLSILQTFSDKAKKKIERSADLRAIRRGFGKDLYKTRSKKVHKRIRVLLDKYYLSFTEIKRDIKKVSKLVGLIIKGYIIGGCGLF